MKASSMGRLALRLWLVKLGTFYFVSFRAFYIVSFCRPWQHIAFLTILFILKSATIHQDKIRFFCFKSSYSLAWTTGNRHQKMRFFIRWPKPTLKCFTLALTYLIVTPCRKLCWSRPDLLALQINCIKSALYTNTNLPLTGIKFACFVCINSKAIKLYVTNLFYRSWDFDDAVINRKLQQKGAMMKNRKVSA